MKVINTHKRIIPVPKHKVSGLLATLATKDDKVWPIEKWPKIRFEKGLKVGAKGGHGMIRYSVEDYVLGELIVFRFYMPKGFEGIHKFEIRENKGQSTKVTHVIIMKTNGFATLQWAFVIRWLHDALIENAFDTIENNFLIKKKFTKWSIWVSLLRFILK